MTETSRPMCQLAPWCALPPHLPTEPCSIIVRRPVEETLDRLAQLAVGGAMNHPHLTVPADRVRTVTVEPGPAAFDRDAWLVAIAKARSAADEYQAIAVELTDLVGRARGLKVRQVTSPEDYELTSPALLGSSLVKLDMAEHLCRLERFQVAAMGYAGAWTLLADSWENELVKASAYGETQVDVRTCRVCQCTDDEGCAVVPGCWWVEDDLCSACQLKTPDEWCEQTGTHILDPDGWRGSAGRPWTDAISLAEFKRRTAVSTTNSAKVPDDRG